MIIKSMSRKTPSFDQLVGYTLAPEGAQIAIYHNLPVRAVTPDRIIEAFDESHELLPKRINGNALYHEIISLEPNIELPIKQQAEALRFIAERYLEKRAPRQLALGVIHTDTAHTPRMYTCIWSSAATLSCPGVGCG